VQKELVILRTTVKRHYKIFDLEHISIVQHATNAVVEVVGQLRGVTFVSVSCSHHAQRLVSSTISKCDVIGVQRWWRQSASVYGLIKQWIVVVDINYSDFNVEMLYRNTRLRHIVIAYVIRLHCKRRNKEINFGIKIGQRNYRILTLTTFGEKVKTCRSLLIANNSAWTLVNHSTYIDIIAEIIHGPPTINGVPIMSARLVERLPNRSESDASI
jgi:hypothetical protein